MKEIFKNILGIEEVQGIIFSSLEGKPVYTAFKYNQPEALEEKAWASFVNALDGVSETELVFDFRKIYIRKIGDGYIFIVLKESAFTALVRLNCEIILPSITRVKKPKGIGRFFKKRQSL